MEKEFMDFIKDERQKFVITIRAQQWNTELRTSADNILIAYDQMTEMLGAEAGRNNEVRGLDLHSVSNSASVNKYTCGKCTGLPDLESYYED